MNIIQIIKSQILLQIDLPLKLWTAGMVSVLKFWTALVEQ